MRPVISNVKVFGLEDSIRAAKYPKAVDIEKLTDTLTPGIAACGQAKQGSGHDNFLNGVIVQFDLTFSEKAWPEAERYHFLEFVSSQSTMHCASRFDIRLQCNQYVTEASIAEAERLKQVYLDDPTEENYLILLYNLPLGFTLTARMTTDYRQLKTIYYQRRFHKLPEWKEFCFWIETLPRFKELCLKEE